MKIKDFIKNSINTICAKYINENNEIEYLPIFYIAGSQTLPPPLEPEEEQKYIEQLDNEDNLLARQTLVERNLRLVVYIAKKFENTGIGLEDLISIGTIGLMKGVNTFKSDKNIKLATYASRCIENEILMHLRSIKKLGAEVYLNEPIGKDKDDNEIALIDILENDEKNIEDEIDLKIKTKKLYTRMKDILKGREQTIIELRFGLRRRKTKNTKSNSKYAWNI